MSLETNARGPVCERGSWLETAAGNTPILLIAPHGGRALSASHPSRSSKVNDLYTAEITRELAKLLDASAIINAGMDRNFLDLNRVPQLIARAPWVLELILKRLGEMVDRFGRATVLLIHGWNVIEPRIDLGVGLRARESELIAPGAAHISASDRFIHAVLAQLAERLRASGIVVSFGLRYPGGGVHNLLQAFTSRHARVPVPALRAIAEIASRGQVDAVQLELSVALRMPGQLRKRCVRAIAEVLRSKPGHTTSTLKVVRSPRAVRPSDMAERARTSAPPSRIGIDFYDPGARIGAMASFELGARRAGARIIALLPDGGVALFTGEGATRHSRTRLSLGPLSLEARGGKLLFRFRGLAVIVPDAAAYLSVERALGSGWLDESVEICAELSSFGCAPGFEANLSNGSAGHFGAGPAVFGRVNGCFRVSGVTLGLDGFGRSGFSFTEVGARKFVSRSRIWTCLAGTEAPIAIELRVVSADQEHRSGHVLGPNGWTRCAVRSVEVETPSMERPPVRIAAAFEGSANHVSTLAGTVENFVPLSRPGFDGARVFSSMGFARFTMGGRSGAGMFEYSRIFARSNGSGAETD